MPNAPSILRVKTFINFLIIKAFIMLVSTQIQNSCQSYSRLFSRILLSVFLLILSWNLSAQIPAQCGSPGCTSNDVRIQRATITDADGKFPICVGNDPINNLFLHLFVSTNTKRKGVSISATLRITVNSVVQDYPIQYCFSNSLNGDNNDLVYSLPSGIYQCGSNVELRTVFTAWGTGLGDFCNGSTTIQCQGTPSKCRFVPGEVIIVQTTPCAQPVITTHPQSTPACDNGPATFTVGYTPVANNTTTVKWQIQNGASWDDIENNTVYSGATTTTLNIQNVNGLNNKVYRALVINTSTDPQVPVENRECVLGSSSATLTVNSNTVGGTVTAAQTICTGSTPATLNLGGSTGNVERWERASSSDFASKTNIVNTTTSLLAADIGALESDTWFRCVVKSGVCPAENSSFVKISVDANPSTASAGSPQERCGTLASLGLGGNAPGIGSGTWTKTSGPLGATVSFSPTANSPNATATVSAAGNYVFTWTISNGVCTSSSANISVNYYNNPGDLQARVDDPTCSTPTGTITVTSPIAGLSFSLNSTDPAAFTNYTGVFSGLAPGNYLIRSRNSNGCISNSLSKTVDEVPGATPAAAIVILTNVSCSSSTGTLKVVQAGSLAEYDNNIYEFSNGGAYGSSPVFGFTAGEGYSIDVRKKTDITCSVNVSCTGEPQELGSVEKKMPSDLIKTVGGDNAIIKAYPNPFSDQIKFVVTTKEKGQASLELFNMSGQKIKSVYNGYMAEGIQNFNFTLPQHEMNSVIYVFRQNGKTVTGKLMHVSNKK